MRTTGGGEPALVAFSGGADSLALLVLLVRSGVHPVACYVDHRLRPDAELAAERELNKANCARLGVPLVVRTVDRGALDALARSMGVEAAAHVLRYRILCEEAKTRHAVLYTAHQWDDEKETVCMRLAQHAPLEHLALRLRTERDGCVICRPLAGWSHRDLVALLVREGFSWSEDSTNHDERFLRNHVRLTTLEGMRRRDGAADAQLTALIVRSWQAQREVDEALSGIDPASVACVRALPSFARREAVYRVLAGTSRVPAAVVDGVVARLQEGDGSFSVPVPGGSLVCRDGRLSFLPSAARPSYVVWGPEVTEKGWHRLPDGAWWRVGGEGDAGALCIDLSRLRSPLLRTVRSGDRVLLAEGERAVSSLLAAWKIPVAYRSSVAVLEDADGIVALFGRAWGGRDRLASRCKSLAPRGVFVYYSRERKNT